LIELTGQRYGIILVFAAFVRWCGEPSTAASARY
jgi:hypothetical protein